MLVDGPGEIVMPDGRSIRADRPMTALCTCRRSHRYRSATPAAATTTRTRRRPPEHARRRQRASPRALYRRTEKGDDRRCRRQSRPPDGPRW
ncbi:CDGSH iron-sulfur domain-containing protein [Kitasatospora sp. NPDC058060]|uniref:CDGSH iron-sulfur domain-containing protein n=1 Tax=Kitasatospora sp. NPDC058060 TaxID=3346318 RepID=UPI0036EA499D